MLFYFRSHRGIIRTVSTAAVIRSESLDSDAEGAAHAGASSGELPCHIRRRRAPASGDGTEQHGKHCAALKDKDRNDNVTECIPE